ncbi:protein kinase domain-containing protein [Halobacillus litoralis]|uniref:protein kinase domain-containing protein n=1 Tax=Halobacillus litoralis TaxID=45668 RepID=UPI001CFEAA3E|nr:protein kinase family protein [Halobacillus litoralis]
MKKRAFNLTPGSQVIGKWNGHKYMIIKELGFGACGTVFLCRTLQGDTYALKMGEDSSRMMLEVNMLKKFGKVQGVKLGPSFVDVDDWVDQKGGAHPFYVMEYIDGISLSSFIKGKTNEWIGICAIQLLTDLEKLHECGYVFGDLKTDNLLVSSSRIRWIDVGGVTASGRAIKEYTEFYDRGYWGMGMRRSEPTYDLFAVTMIMMEMAYPAKFEKGSSPLKTLESKLASSSQLKPYRQFIQSCWKGRYKSAQAMKAGLTDILLKRQEGSSRLQKRRDGRRGEEMELAALSIFAAAVFGSAVVSFWL